MLSRFHLIPEHHGQTRQTDGQTGRQTDGQICYINIARRDKNRFRKMFSVYTLLKRVHTDSQT